jgi:thiol:disulfide interchange protein DsbC
VKRLLLLLLLTIGFINTASATTPKEIINNHLIQKAGKVEIVRNLGNLYEVVINRSYHKQILYVTRDGKYIIAGALFDSKTGKNITVQREKEINRINLAELSLQDAIHIKFGKGGRKLIAVMDPECPFCRRSFSYLKDRNVDLYVFFMPLSFHKNALSWSKKVLCSNNPGNALLELEQKGEIPACTKNKEKEGENLLKKHILTAQMIGARATPTFITEEGYLIEGLNKKKLDSYLREKQK